MRVAKVLWVVATAILLAVTLYVYDPVTGRDADVLLIYGMLILTFPSGFLVAGVFSLLAYIASSIGLPSLYAQYPEVDIGLTWLVFFFVGYVQWFTALPRVVRRLRERGHTIA